MSNKHHKISIWWYFLSTPQLIATYSNKTFKKYPIRSYLPNPSARAGYDTRSIFKRSLTGLNSELFFSLTVLLLTKAEEPSLSYYSPIAGGRIIGFIPFPRVLVLCEMQSVSFRIWTRVVVSISYDDNHYTTGTFSKIYNSISYSYIESHAMNITISAFEIRSTTHTKVTF